MISFLTDSFTSLFSIILFTSFFSSFLPFLFLFFFAPFDFFIVSSLFSWACSSLLEFEISFWQIVSPFIIVDWIASWMFISSFFICWSISIFGSSLSSITSFTSSFWTDVSSFSFFNTSFFSSRRICSLILAFLCLFFLLFLFCFTSLGVSTDTIF